MNLKRALVVISSLAATLLFTGCGPEMGTKDEPELGTDESMLNAFEYDVAIPTDTNPSGLGIILGQIPYGQVAFRAAGESFWVWDDDADGFSVGAVWNTSTRHGVCRLKNGNGWHG